MQGVGPDLQGVDEEKELQVLSPALSSTDLVKRMQRKEAEWILMNFNFSGQKP